MKLPQASTTVRLAFGLALLTVSLVMAGSVLGLFVDGDRTRLESRLRMTELLATAVTMDVSEGDAESAGRLMELFRERNPDVRSIRLRPLEGAAIDSTGTSASEEGDGHGTPSALEQIVLPIRRGSVPWGDLKIEFVAEKRVSRLLRAGSPYTVALFLAVSGFFGYWLILKRTLTELDLTAVVPDRVNAVLDTLGEGIVMLDLSGRVVLTNEAFRRKTNRLSSEIVGYPLSKLPWEGENDEGGRTALPWEQVLEGGERRSGCQLHHGKPGETRLCFAVNAASIRSPDGQVRGAVVTFNDVTELQRKNANLERAFERLSNFQQEIRRQNEELRILATSDPLTGVLNRRSLYEGLHALFEDQQERERPIGCIMADLDHFKQINDDFGHATGDAVIKLLARVLEETVPPHALVGRYGGEEFCVVIPGLDETGSVALADRIRRVVHARSATIDELGARRVGASLGVSCDVGRTLSVDALIDLADKALYAAKESGRGCVVPYSRLSAVQAPDSTVADEPPLEKCYSAALSGAGPSPREPRDGTGSADGPGGRGKEVSSLAQALLFDRLTRAVRRSNRTGVPFALIVMEFPTVALVRNAAGEAAADKLLEIARSRLCNVLSSTDGGASSSGPEGGQTLLALGNGRYVVLLSDVSGEETIPWIVQRLQEMLGTAVQIEGREVLLDARFGASVFPGDASDGPALLSAAGSALHDALASKERNTCSYFSDELAARSERFLLLQSQLHTALEKDELSLMYQPLVDMRTGRISSFEALLRWRHPELGMVSPELFIPIAEQSGLIYLIGNWVVRTACRQLRAWQDRGRSGLSMAVNLAAPQLRRRELVRDIAAEIEAAGIDPGSLTLELTESALIEDFDFAVSVVEELSDIGARVALDDFGTGYSSLSYLKNFSIDVVKIDRSFFTDFPDEEHSMTIVSAIISLVHSLGLKVVAEGVETDGQLAFLQSLDIDVVQGYHFSAPLTCEQASALLENQEAIRRKFRAASLTNIPAGEGCPAVISGVLNEAPRHAA